MPKQIIDGNHNIQAGRDITIKKADIIMIICLSFRKKILTEKL